MTQPAKVIGFLDIGGAWDPSLALVMIGALGVYLPLARLRRGGPADVGCAADDTGADGSGQSIDWRLTAGAASFGIGWGLSGYCPGPAIVSLATGLPGILLFVGAMAAGMFVHGRLFHRI